MISSSHVWPMSLLSLNGSLRKLCFKVLLNEEEKVLQSSSVSVKSECLTNVMHFCVANEKWQNIFGDHIYWQERQYFKSAKSLSLSLLWINHVILTVRVFSFPFIKWNKSIWMKGLINIFLVIHLCPSWIKSNCVRRGSLWAFTTISKMRCTLQEEHEILINPAAFANQFLCFTPGSWWPAPIFSLNDSR